MDNLLLCLRKKQSLMFKQTQKYHAQATGVGAS